MRQGKGEEGTPCHGDDAPPLPGQGNLSPSCHPSSFACAAVLLAVQHSSPRTGTLLSSPLALGSTQYEYGEWQTSRDEVTYLERT
jgi:hypothetical protein